MIPAFDPLARVKADLERIIRARSANDLADRLVGRGLPALGGDEEPAEILFRALILSPTRPGTPRILADLLGTLCAATCAQLEALREVRGVVGVTLRSDTGLDAVRSHLERNEPYLYNSFLLASLLPPSDDLFDSLKRLRQLGLETNVLLAGGGRTSRQLLQALIYQQTDDSLFEMWLGLLRSDASAGDANLLDAWTGLLWTPPSDALRNAGESLDVRRVAIGLDALHHGVQRLPSALRYLRTAVRQLRDSFARSPDFWARELRPLLNILPELVNEVLCEQWPNLDESDPHYMPTLSQRAEAVWSSLEDHERQSILSAADKSVDRPWDEIWTNLLFQPPRLQLPPQEVRTALFEIRHALERRYPGVAPQARPDIPDTETSPQERLERRPRRRSPRLAEFERVQGVLVEVDQQLQVGDLIRATEYLEDLLKSQEQAGTEAALVAKTLSNAGHLALRRGYAGWAMQLYQRAEDLHVGDPVIGNGLAEVLRALGRLEEAEWKYRNTVSSFPNDVVAHCGLAEVLKEQGRLDEAEQQYRLTIATFPESVVAHNGLAEILREEGQLDQAEQEYRITASSFPNDAVALSGLAEVLKEQGRLDEAEREYRIAISTFPNSVFAQNGLAEVLKEQGRLDEAEQQYRIALSTFPNNAVAQSGLAEVLKEQGRLDEAEQQYRIAISTFSHNVVAQSGLAEVLREQGRLDEAEQQFRLAASTFPNDVVAQNSLAEVSKEQGRLDEAEQQYRLVVSRVPRDVVAQSGLAEVLKKQGRLDEAEQQYRLAISRFPRNVVAKCGLAEVLKEQGRLDEAEEQYRTSVATFPNDAVAQCGLAEVLKQQGRLDKAEDAYRQAHDRWPRNRVARNGLANLLRTRHRFAEALALLPEPMELRTRADFVDLHLVGMIQLGMGSIDAATRIFRSGRDNARWKEERSYFASALVVARLRQERYDEALADLEGLENAQPQVATLRLHALAGRRDESRVRPLHEDLDSRFLTFQPPVQASLKLIESAFGLDRPGAIRRPTADEVTAIAGAEIEMLLAA